MIVHVIYPEDFLCSTDFVFDRAHDALIDAAVDEYVKVNGHISHDADGDLIWESIRAATPRPTDLEEAKALLTDLGVMTFART